MKAVKFIKPYSPYATGDIAGVSDKEAEELIKADIAHEYKSKTEKKTVDTAPVNKQVSDPEVKK